MPKQSSYETPKKAGYSYIKNEGNGSHLLFNEHTQTLERFRNSKNYSGWALIYKNTHLEFCCTVKY